MTVKTLESRAARENWRDLLDTATAGQADVIITRYGKPVTAMIRYEDYVAVQEELVKLRAQQSEAYQTMLASESTLSREWDSPEEDEAWADL
ncbi:MAG TPA: type II toxin-antitoxin system Phd/YefM family antitoxin [Candidatus Tectomicrobia bacterium]|jgi:prevent-host-death family protein